MRRIRNKTVSIVLFTTILLMFVSHRTNSQPLMEKLDRGVVAIKINEDVYINWRLLGNDPFTAGFNVYRHLDNGTTIKANEQLLLAGTNFIDTNATGATAYSVAAVIDNKEEKASGEVKIWDTPSKRIGLQLPEGYRPNDASVADLDGDGQYEIVIHIAGRGRDNSQAGSTSSPILQAYKLDGTLLWTINLGRNIREGAHYTQFMVYDLDGDGIAEVACKTADGTIDGAGQVIGNSDSLYVEPDRTPTASQERIPGRFPRPQGGITGKILKGPEYLTVFDGKTGKAISTVDYIPARHPKTLYPTETQMKEIWGDGTGNRGERYLACIAYLDGNKPSLVMCRGYYTRAVLVAWDLKDKKLTHRWTFDSEDGTPGNKKYSGQGNHNLSVGDVDGDGKDEIIYGACVIDDNGKGLYSTGFGHGDALHFSDLDPTNPGLEVFNIQERFDDAGMNFREAGTGKVLWKKPSVQADTEGGDKGEGPGRGCAMNIDPRHPGHECWVRGAGITGIYNAKGKKISEKTPSSCNFGIWWDGDLLRELLDGNYVGKWDWEKNETNRIFVAEGHNSINGTKSTPVLSADLFGDWREEFILVNNDFKSITIFTTTIQTEHRLYTLMHDPVYRLGIAWQNVAYNQPPHTSYYIGHDMLPPTQPKIRIKE